MTPPFCDCTEDWKIFGLGRAGRRKVLNEVGSVHIAVLLLGLGNRSDEKHKILSCRRGMGREITYHSYGGRTEMEEMGKL